MIRVKAILMCHIQEIVIYSCSAYMVICMAATVHLDCIGSMSIFDSATLFNLSIDEFFFLSARNTKFAIGQVMLIVLKKRMAAITYLKK